RWSVRFAPVGARLQRDAGDGRTSLDVDLGRIEKLVVDRIAYFSHPDLHPVFSRFRRSPLDLVVRRVLLKQNVALTGAAEVETIFRFRRTGAHRRSRAGYGRADRRASRRSQGELQVRAFTDGIVGRREVKRTH